MNTFVRLKSELRSWLRAVTSRSRLEREMDEELAFHLESYTQELIQRGVAPEEAARRARIEFGGITAHKEEMRASLGLRLWDDLRADLRFSLRMLLKNPGLSVAVLLTLALGIGANTAMFTIDYAVFLAPLPYPHPGQLVMLQSKVQGHNDWISAGDFLDWKRQSAAFQDLNAVSWGGFNIATQDVSENILASRVTTGFYPMMGDRFYLGRNFLPDEALAARDHVVILTHAMWKRLGGNPNILGTAIPMDGEPYTVVGVLAPGPRDRGAPVSVPLVFKPEQINHEYHWLNVMGRLKPGVSIQQAQANMDAVTARIAKAYPKSNQGWSVSIESLKDSSLPRDRKLTLWLLLGAVAFVLLIACLNVANLLLASGMTRQREVAIRGALGASRAIIFVQFLTESLLLAILGGALGVAAGYAMLKGLVALSPPNTLPSPADLRLSLPVLLFTFAAAALAGIVFGCAPAWYASRVDPGEAMKAGGRAGADAGSHRLRRILIVSEFALALSLLAGAGLAVHSFWNLVQVDPGVRTDHILTFVLAVPDARSKDPQAIIAYYHRILAGIRSVPGVTDAGVMSGMPLQVSGFSMPFSIAGSSTDPSAHHRAGQCFESEGSDGQ